VDQLSRECDLVGEMEVFPEDGDEPATVFHPTGYATGGGCGGPWHGGVEDDAPARNETHSPNDSFPAILSRSCPHRFEPRHGETRRKRIVRTCMIVRP
jgi:hypothetical protein